MLNILLNFGMVEIDVDTDEYYISDSIYYIQPLFDKGRLLHMINVSTDDTEQINIVLYKEEMI